MVTNNKTIAGWRSGFLTRFIPLRRWFKSTSRYIALLAQLVERQFCKLDVIGSNPIKGSKIFNKWRIKCQIQKEKRKKNPGEFLAARKKHKSRQKIYDAVKRVLKELETKESSIFCIRGRKLLVGPPSDSTLFQVMKKKSTYYVVYKGRNSNEYIDVDSGNTLYDHGTDKKPQIIFSVLEILEDNKNGFLSGYIKKQE